jgi:hypothetical protein
MHETPVESRSTKTAKSIEAEPVEDFTPVVVDEEAEIERRRKKRQEVKARLGMQDTDLRIQAIEHAASSRQVTPATEPVATQDSVSGMYTDTTFRIPNQHVYRHHRHGNGCYQGSLSS